MPRKTHRVGKKKKNTTHKKRKYVIRKYKFLRGGLGENDYAKIGINNNFRFGHSGKLDYEKIEEFKKYVFGSEEHAQKWEEILRLCCDKEIPIPFYILTSGNKVGIIRTLQLLELADCVTEVLCNSRNKLANPEIDIRAFDRMNKYQIIQYIHAERFTHPQRGIFIDNDKRNNIGHELCSNVEFIHATGKKISKDSNETIFMDYLKNIREFHPLYSVVTTELRQKMYSISHTNLVDISLLDTIIVRLKSGNTDIIFADFDGTMSPWGGALLFQFPFFNIYFNDKFGVFTSPL